jgi:hypothetical protein
MDNRDFIEKPEVNMEKQFTVHSSQFTVKNEKGMVLVVSLLLLLVATVVGITALSTSTTNVMITGNQRLNEINFRAADSGLYVSVPIINSIAFDKSISATYGLDPDLTIDNNLVDEISGGLPRDSDCPALTANCSPAPDLQFRLGSGGTATTISVDIDYLYSGVATGSAILMFMGYEGTGAGAGSGGVLIYYPIDSYAVAPAGSQKSIYGVYQYVTR